MQVSGHHSLEGVEESLELVSSPVSMDLKACKAEEGNPDR
jgi:hypothetical protein